MVVKMASTMEWMRVLKLVYLKAVMMVDWMAN